MSACGRWGFPLPLFSVCMNRVVRNKHISCVIFASNGSTIQNLVVLSTYKELTKTKKYPEFEMHERNEKEWFQQMQNYNTIKIL